MTEPPRLRVLVVAEGPPARGGMSSYAVTTVGDEGLRSQFDISFLNTARRATRRGGALSWDNVRFLVLDAVALWRSAPTSDLVHLVTVADPPLPLIRTILLTLVARCRGAAVLCHVHSALINAGTTTPDQVGSSARRGFRLLGRLSTLAAVSERGRCTLEQLSAKPVTVLVNGVDTSLWTPTDRPESPVGVLFVGTLCVRKGLLDLIEAAVAVTATRATPWRLMIVGGPAQVGESEATLIRRAAVAAGLEESLLGELDDASIRRLQTCSHVFVLPSHAEGQPIAILEAMAAGLPVVATTVGAIPAMITDGAEGRLVPPGDTHALSAVLSELLDDPAQRRRLGLAGRRRVVRNHSLPMARAALSAAYRDTVGPRGRRHTSPLGREQSVGAKG